MFYECSTSVPRVLALHSWNIVACPGVVEHPWNTRGTSWTLLHRRPQISAREDERAPGRFVTDVTYEFTKPPKAALALALQAISKFRIGVDKDGQGVDRPERGASASFQVAKFEVLPALLAHV